jgi:hypothetical protein
VFFTFSEQALSTGFCTEFLFVFQLTTKELTPLCPDGQGTIQVASPADKHTMPTQTPNPKETAHG